MTLPASIRVLGTFKGTPGAKGDTGSLAFADGEVVAADQPFGVEMVGPESNRGAYFKMPRGLPGVNAVAADSAVATYLAAPDSASGGEVRKQIRDGAASAVQEVVPPSLYRAGDLSAVAGAKLTIPTHVSPSGGESTHPSVLATPAGFGGYRYWMAHTPYPAGAIADEDPNICASMDGVTWEVPSGLTNPIDDAPGGTVYNSDTELVMGSDGRLWLMWRQVDDAAKTETLFVSKSADGRVWTTKAGAMVQSYTTLPVSLSPTLVQDGDTWLMWVVDMSYAPNKLVRWRSSGDDLADFGEQTGGTITGLIPGKEPWHVSVRRVGGQYVGLLTVCGTGTSGNYGELQVITSMDGITWEASGTSVIPAVAVTKHDRLYRASFIPEYVSGMLKLRTWYSAVLSTPTLTQWNIFLTDLESAAAGAPVVRVAPGDPIPAGLPGNRQIISLHSGAPAEVARNTVTNSAPATKIDYWGEGYWGAGGAGTQTRETTGGPPKGSPAWMKKAWTTAPGVGTNYHAFGSNTVTTVAVDDMGPWILSAWLFCSYGSPVSSVRVIFYNAAGVALGGEVVGMYYPHKSGQWERRFVVTTPPAGAVRAVIRGYFENASVPVAAITGMSSLMANPGTVLRDYHDGALSPTPELTPSWVGIAYESPSILTASHSYMRFWDGAKEWPM